MPPPKLAIINIPVVVAGIFFWLCFGGVVVLISHLSLASKKRRDMMAEGRGVGRFVWVIPPQERGRGSYIGVEERKEGSEVIQ